MGKPTLKTAMNTLFLEGISNTLKTKPAKVESTGLNLVHLNNVANIERQKIKIAEDVARYGGLSKTNLINELGLSDAMLEGIGMGAAGSTLPKQTVKGIGKVVNSAVAPFAYSPKIHEMAQRFKKAPLKFIKSVLKDKPQYVDDRRFMPMRQMEVGDVQLARELPYKALFGRESSVSKAGMDIYKKVGKKKYEFNLENETGRAMHDFAKEYIDDAIYYDKGRVKGGVARGHPVMGGFNFKKGVKTTGYKDVWDVGLNRSFGSHVKDAFKETHGTRKLFQHLGKVQVKKAQKKMDGIYKSDLVTSMQRLMIDAITNPITIVGKYK